MQRCGQQRFVFGPAWYHTYQKAQSCRLSLLSHCFDKQPDNKSACRCFAPISLRQALELSPNDAPTFQPSQLLSCMARRQTRVICPVTPWSSCDTIVGKAASLRVSMQALQKKTCLQSCKNNKIFQTNVCSWPCFVCRCIASKWPRLALELSPKNLAQGL